MSAVPPSIEHRHSADSGCLTAVPALFLGKLDDAKHPVLEPRAGWWRCDRLTSRRPMVPDEPDGDLAASMTGTQRYYERPNGYLVHEHGQTLAAHEPREKCGHPGGAA